MAGLSTTHYDSATIALSSGASGDVATATSGGTVGGRALSDIAHGSGGGLRYCEIEVVSLRSIVNAWTIGVVDNTSNLGVWLGGGTEAGFLWRGNPAILRFVNGGSSTSHGNSEGGVGMRALLWVDCASRKIWLTATDREGGRYGEPTARPDLGTVQTWTIPGTGDLRVGLTPARGSTGDANALRFRSRYSQLRVRGAELLGALPWDARSSTIVADVSGVSNGTTLRWAWFDENRPDLLTQPTSQGTVTVTSGQVSVTVSTSLDAGGVGFLLLSNTDGTVVQCRSHAAPAGAP